jgi:hypothetical protein
VCTFLRVTAQNRDVPQTRKASRAEGGDIVRESRGITKRRIMISLMAARINQISSRARTGDLAFPTSRPSGPSRGFFRRKDGRGAARRAASRRPTPLAATNMEFAYKSGISICGLGARGAPGRFVRSRDTEMKRSLPFPPWPSPLPHHPSSSRRLLPPSRPARKY